MTLKCFKQNRVDRGVLLRQLQGRGCQLQAAVGGLDLLLGTGKAEVDQRLAAPGLAETESEQDSSSSPGKNKAEARQEAAKTPGSTWGAEPPFQLDPALSGCCEQGRHAAVQQGSQPQLLHQVLHPSLLTPASLPDPVTPAGTAHEPELVLQKPLPLDAFHQCIAPQFFNTLLAHTQATPSF